MPTVATVEDRLRTLLAAIPGGTSQTSDTQWEARCPSHEDRTASLCIGRLGSGGIGVCCQAGCATESVMQSIGLPMSHLRPPRTSHSNGSSHAAPTGTIVATYDYRDADGTLLFQVCRFDPKDFRQRRPTGPNQWDWSVKGVKQVPYRLPELVAADASTPIFIVEGEKDADALAALGLIATCNAGGAAKINPKTPKPRCKWKKSHAEYFAGRDAVIIPDNDQPGRDHADGVARSLVGIARSIKILTLPSLPEKGDASDWLTAGGTAVALLELTTKTPAWVPSGNSGDASEKSIAQDGSKSTPWAGHKLTDLGNAERFARQHGDDVRYCYAWGSWLVWDGTRWATDEMGEVERRAKRTVRSIYTEASEADNSGEAREIAKWAEESEKRNSINAMIALARSEQPIPVSVSSLDSEAWLLNCENGTINLNDGTLRKQRQSDFITKRCPVEYPTDEIGEPAVWLNFLDRIFASNSELIEFVQRLMGMSLVGEVREHILPIFWGAGANGKSTLVETWCGMLGKDYSMKAPSGFLMQKNRNDHPTELADLHGKRLVSAIETAESGRLSEALVKELTGGDTIRARRMREDFWEFQPSHTVVLATNHKPTIRGTDFGIWRRVCLVPFIVTIPDDEKDETLKNKLQKEWPQILRWSVLGCIEWQRGGLRPPEMVQMATQEYRGSSDLLADFLDEQCLIGDAYRIKASLLYHNYRKWAEAGGEFVESQRKFGERMSEKGFQRHKSNSVNWWLGVTDRPNGEDIPN